MNANLRRPIPTLAVLSLGLLACGDDEVPIGPPGTGTPDAGGIDTGGTDTGGTDTGGPSAVEAELRALAASFCEADIACGSTYSGTQAECEATLGDQMDRYFGEYVEPGGEACERAYLDYLTCGIENGYCYTYDGDTYFEAYSEDCSPLYEAAAEACDWDSYEYEEY